MTSEIDEDIQKASSGLMMEGFPCGDMPVFGIGHEAKGADAAAVRCPF
jgi:hypothetical protein